MEKIIDYLKSGIAIIGIDSKIQKANQTFMKIFGSGHEIINNSFYSFFKTTEAAVVKVILTQMIHSRLKQDRIELKYLRKGNDEIWISIVFTLITNLDEPDYFLVEVDDITTRKNIEYELQSAKEIKNAFNKQNGMLFKVKKIDGKFIHTLCDGELLYRLGFRPEEIIGKEVKDFLPKEIAIQKEKYFEQAWNGDLNIQYEGHLNDITYLAIMMPIYKKNKVDEVIVSCVDITKQKQVEEELRSTKELLESVIENSGDVIILTNLDGKVQQVNLAFETTFGWSKEEILNRSIREIGMIPPHLLAEYDQIICEVKRGSVIVNYEEIRNKKDGSQVNILLTLSPIKDRYGHVRGWTSIVKDITDRKNTEEYLMQSEKLAVVGQLAAGIGHEIRNPLTALKGFVQLLQKNESINQSYLEVMTSELNRIELIVSELLVLSKPQAISLSTINVMDILYDIVTLIQPQAIMNNIEIKTVHENESLLIEGNENQLKQVFINFLKNAIEAMPKGGEIIIHVEKADDQLNIRFIDQGFGIPPDQLGKLGEPFYTTKEKGTGLGLLVSKKIIDHHRGSFRVKSIIGHGTEIEVLLPLSV